MEDFKDEAPPFWKVRALEEMSDQEWESLCDGCAKCCLVKLEDMDTGETLFTNLHCRLLDAKTCRCSDYENRQAKAPECIRLTPEKIPEYHWLPQTCAYRLVHEGKDLPDWHHLVCGDPREVHRRGVSCRSRTVTEEGVSDEDAVDYIVAWPNLPPDHFRRGRRRR